MKTLKALYVIPLIISWALLTGFAQPPDDNLFINGGFETGDFSGWTVVQYPTSFGDWFVYSGTQSPDSGLMILPPPSGTFAATTDQTDPSSQIVYQDIQIPSSGSVMCSVIVYYQNSAEAFINGPDLDFTGDPNQQARIDIMDPDAPDFDIGDGVLLNVFLTEPGDPLSLDYTTVNFDLSDFAGMTVRFRAAEVDNQNNFLFSIDNVQCDAPRITDIPTLSEWGLIAMAGVLGIIGILAVRRRKAAA